MSHSPSVGPVAAAPADVAPLRAVLVAVLASAVALRQLDWWKLLERGGRLPQRRGQLCLHVTAIGLTFMGSDAPEEVADEQDAPLCALRHALLRVVLEAALFYALLALTFVCGLSGGDAQDHEHDALAYLADALVGGWGESLVHAIACALFIAATEVGAAALKVALTSQGRRPPRLFTPVPEPQGENADPSLESASPRHKHPCPAHHQRQQGPETRVPKLGRS